MMCEILMGAYAIIGVLLSFYWYDKEYSEEYKAMIEDGIDVERGMACILLLIMAAFWPIKFLFNLIRKRSI